MKNLKSNFALFLLFVVIIIIGILFPSCESKSGNIKPVEPEMIIIISNPIYDLKNDSFYYKVKRIEKNNVVTFVYDKNKYEINDTILKRIYYL